MDFIGVESLGGEKIVEQNRVQSLGASLICFSEVWISV